MDGVVVTFLMIGGLSLLLLVLSLVGGHAHLGHLHLGHMHLDHLHLGHVSDASGAGGDSGAQLTLPAIAGFIGSFGFVGAIVATLVPGHSGGRTLLAAAVGLAVGVPSAWAAGRLMNAAINMRTDATLSSDDLVGAMGVVISPVPDGGYGEVRLAVAGQPMKFNARAEAPLAIGAPVFVIEVLSPTSVLVEPTPTTQ